MTQPLCILGAGGNLLDILDTIEAVNRERATWSVVGMFDDRKKFKETCHGFPVLGPLSAAGSSDGCLFISSIWNEGSFRIIDQVLKTTGIALDRYATMIHPRASVSSRARIGRGVLIHQGASIGGNVVIEDQVSIGPGCIVGHDAVIRSYTCIAAGAVVSGGVECESNCYVGSASCIRQNLRIGSGSLIGLGSVVVKDVEPDAVVMGNPAASRRPAIH